MSKEHQGRGQLTDRIKERSAELLSYEIEQDELRFMAYLHYVLVNDRKVDINKIDGVEVGILNDYFIKKYLGTDDKGRLTCTLTFWQALSELVYLGYVDLSE